MLRGAVALALLTTLGCDQQQGRNADACQGDACDDPVSEVNAWELEQLVDQLASDHQDYREAEADLGFHFSSFGVALDNQQYMAFVEAFWASHRSERERYQAAALGLRNGIESASPQELADEAGLDAISGAGIRAYIEGLVALADTPEAQASLTGLLELRAATEQADKPLGLFISDEEQEELVGVAIESMFAEAVLRADISLQSTPYFSPAHILKDTLDTLQADGDPWGIASVREELEVLWTVEAAADADAYTVAVRKWVEDQPRSPIEQSLAMIAVTGSLLADDRVVGAEPLPDSVRDAMQSFQTFAAAAGFAHQRGLQPLVAKLGEHSRVWGRVAAPWVGHALSVLSSSLIVGLEAYDLHNNPNANVYDQVAVVGSVISAAGAVTTAFGGSGLVLVAVGTSVRMLAGSLADAQRYEEARSELRGESRELLIVIGLPESAAHALASADPDSLHILAGSTEIYGGLGIGLTPSEIQQIAANNAEMMLDRSVLEAGHTDSIDVYERTLMLALLVDGGLLDREKVVPMLANMGQAYRASNPLREHPSEDMKSVVYSHEVEAAFRHLVWSVGSHVFPNVREDDPFGGLPDPCYTIAFGLGAPNPPQPAGLCVAAESLYPSLNCQPLASEPVCWE